MCGIAGFTFPRGLEPEGRVGRFGPPLRRMTDALGHRGPDGRRGLLLDGVALGHARLAIVDVEGGQQPMRDPATGITLVFNGEIFNHMEIRQRLGGRYPFRTRSDTEVLLAAWIHAGPACLDELNGQFAFAVWDPRSSALWLARDRVGILPLFYAETPDGLAFASEAKALFAGGCARPALDPAGLKETFQLWSPVPPRTCFEGVQQLPPRSWACFRDGRLQVRRYWDLDLEAAGHGSQLGDVDEASALEELGERLTHAVELRLRADVPVAAYLSGGLDSSLLCALANQSLGGKLSTFSIAFADARYDERQYQQAAARHLGTRHRVLEVPDGTTGARLPDAVAHAEQVLLRSAPAPFLALSAFVQRHGVKVVLSGEGADEAFLGYDIFKETRIRQFWARRPESRWRAALLRRILSFVAADR